jgi:hypothetical protein
MLKFHMDTTNWFIYGKITLLNFHTMETETLKIWIQIITAFIAIYGALLSTGTF